MIPQYRAKKMNSNEYVEGCLIKHLDLTYSIEVLGFADNGSYRNSYEIDQSTLSIHFPDMTDSEGNEIFASLSEDGKGGDNLSWSYDIGNDKIMGLKYDKEIFNWNYHWWKVIGIQE
jgi:hypothetical protein